MSPPKLGQKWLVSDFLATLKRVGSLTNREIQVLEMLFLGGTREHISESLGISISTVRQHVKNARRKLDASCLTDLISIYVRTLDETKSDGDARVSAK